jgi:hypothetical protein
VDLEKVKVVGLKAAKALLNAGPDAVRGEGMRGRGRRRIPIGLDRQRTAALGGEEELIAARA